MSRLVRLFGVAAVLLAALSSLPVRAAEQPEFRAYWVDAFGPGIFNAAEIDKLIADVKAANMNAIVAQVGRRGDCFCNNASMPRTEAAIAPAPFDPLQTLIEKAHAQGIEVHAWIITTSIWNSAIAPKDPSHVFNTHGPSRTGADNWLMMRNDGAYRAGADYLLDPGHPDAADYIVRMYTSVVEHYDVDGINFDRVRYPDTSGAPTWGYNPTSVARFQAATGRSDVPAPTDPQWMQWRRDQVTNIVRRVYLETYAINPDIRVSADTITYGYGPQDASVGGYENTRTYREVLQDWRGWMQEGILDQNIPMNYKREFCAAPNLSQPGCFNLDQRLAYEQWNDFAKDHQYNRHVAIGAAIYLNYIDGSIAQVRKALAPSSNGNPSHGWVGYAYRTPDALTNTGQRAGDISRAELTRALTQPSEYDPITPPVFAAPASVPEMTWKTQPTTGHVLGRVTTPDGTPFDQVTVELRNAETDALVATRLTDGSGVFGFVDLQPGRYKALVDNARAKGQRVIVFTVRAGEVTTVEVTPEPKQREGRTHITDRPGHDPHEAQSWPNGVR